MKSNRQFRENEMVVMKSKINGEWVENCYFKIGGKFRVLHHHNEFNNADRDSIPLGIASPSARYHK